MSRTRRVLACLAVVLASGLVAASSATAQVQLSRVLTSSAVVDGTREEPLRWPVALAAASANELAVADAWRPRLLVFRRVGASWSLARAAELPGVPVAAAHDGRRYLIALRGRSDLATLDGVAAPAIGARELPRSVVPGALAALPGGALLVWDVAGSRLLELRGDEAVVRFGLGESVSAIAPDGAGGVWLAVAAASEVRRYDAAGRELARWTVPGVSPAPAWPSGIVVEPGGRVFVLDRHGHRVVALDGAGRLAGVGGSRGWEPGLLMLPAGLARVGDELVVCDLGNGRLQSFAVLGGPGR